MIKSSQGLLKMIFIILLFVVISTVVALVRGRMLVVRMYSVSGHSFAKVKIVGLADLHGEMIDENQERIFQKVRDAEPDFIVYLGDMVERTRADESADSLILLTERLRQIAPIYYVNGNHEQDVKKNEPDVYKRLSGALNNLEAVLLDDETVSFTVNSGVTVNLCGITTHYYWGEKEYSLTSNLKKMDGVNIMICHYPESVIWYDAFEGGGLDLALCGHTHGGLVRIPFLGGYYAPEQSRWPQYDLGEYHIFTDTTWSNYGGKDGSDYLGTMIISGGLAGEHGIPRLNNPMEVSIVEIE